jgi:hypothetical protein
MKRAVPPPPGCPATTSPSNRLAWRHPSLRPTAAACSIADDRSCVRVYYWSVASIQLATPRPTAKSSRPGIWRRWTSRAWRPSGTPPTPEVRAEGWWGPRTCVALPGGAAGASRPPGRQDRCPGSRQHWVSRRGTAAQRAQRPAPDALAPPRTRIARRQRVGRRDTRVPAACMPYHPALPGGPRAPHRGAVERLRRRRQGRDFIAPGGRARGGRARPWGAIRHSRSGRQGRQGQG